MSGPGQTNEEGNTMNDDTDPKTCSDHGDVLIWEPGGDDMPTVYGRWYCPSCQRRLMSALDASRARGIKQGRVEQPTASAGDVERLAEVINRLFLDKGWRATGDDIAHVIATSDWLADVRREEREWVLGEVERRVADLPTTRTQAWTTGWDSVPLHAVQVIVREARGGAR